MEAASAVVSNPKLRNGVGAFVLAILGWHTLDIRGLQHDIADAKATTGVLAELKRELEAQRIATTALQVQLARLDQAMTDRRR